MVEITAPPVPDYAGWIRKAAVDKTARTTAAMLFARVMAQAKPLIADHGSHHPRASDSGRCSLEYAADVHGMLDLRRDDDTQLVLDAGTIHGAWLAALFGAACETFKKDGCRYTVGLEVKSEYRGSPGTIDMLVVHDDTPEPRFSEPCEIKTTAGTGELKPPDNRKLYQCLQAGQYGLSENIPVVLPRFTILTHGFNVGNNKEGVPHPKLVAHTYNTADYKPLVDAEIDRLTALAKLPKAMLEEEATVKELADATEDFRCTSCRYSKCARNQNPIRWAL